MVTQPERHRVRGASRVEPLVRGLVVAALGVEAYIHFDLAEAMQVAAPDGIGGGTLFRIQAGAAVLAAVLVLVTGSRLGYGVSALVALCALGPVLLYSFVNVPALGPMPSMYDPTWYPAKVVSIIAETLAVVMSAVGIALITRRRTSGIQNGGGSWARA